MFSHIFVGVSDFERALKFYEPLMASLGVQQRFCDRSRPWAGWQSTPDPRPLFLIGAPFDKLAHHPGNGQMTALLAQTREAVVQAYAVAIANGGSSEGGPGLRPEYHAIYFGAYFRDPDGNKLCVACHAPQEAPSHAQNDFIPS
jgi:catechol 2,3-dioxygenase-like lactoylglutathione lyase family enzyme